MRNLFISIAVFVFFLGLGQENLNVKVLDIETNLPISQVKIVANNEIFYTNDDGNALLPYQTKEIVVSAISYEEIKVKLPLSSIKLTPIYKTIDEVHINPVDISTLFSKVLKDYNKNYAVRPTLFEGTYKEKSYIDDNIHKLLVADISLWNLKNKFDYRKDNLDSFLQMNIKDIRYYKTKRNEPNYPFSQKGLQDRSDVKAFIQRLFLFDQIFLINYYSQNVKTQGRILNEVGDLQEIYFKTDYIPEESVQYEGNFLYNKKSNVITFFKVNYIQSNTSRIFMNNLDKEIKVNTTNFTVSYDFIEDNGKYFPSKVDMDLDGNIKYEDKTYPIIQNKQFIFQKHQIVTSKGVNNKIDLSKNITENIPQSQKEISGSTLLLSNEERKFIDEH